MSMQIDREFEGGVSFWPSRREFGHGVFTTLNCPSWVSQHEVEVKPEGSTPSASHFQCKSLHIWNPEVERNSSTIDTSIDRYGKDWRGSRDRGFGG